MCLVVQLFKETARQDGICDRGRVGICLLSNSSWILGYVGQTMAMTHVLLACAAQDLFIFCISKRVSTGMLILCTPHTLILCFFLV